MQVTKATFNAMKASSMARRLTAKSARRKSAWLLIDKYYFSLSSTEYTKSMLILIKNGLLIWDKDDDCNFLAQ